MVNLNFREFILSTGKKIIAGKSAEQNDLLVSSANRSDFLLHTIAPGSPFINLGNSPTKEEIKEASVFCALKSHDFRDNQKDVLVHLFSKANCQKNKKDKSGTWEVGKILQTINVKKSEITKLARVINEENIK